LGQTAPAGAKAAWDPDGTRRRALLAQAVRRLPEFEVRAGGSTSIDVTRKGIDKAYGIRKLLAALGTTADNLLFVGDRLDPDGNDHPVLAMGVRCVPVRDWHHTLAVVEGFDQWWDGALAQPPFRTITEPPAPTT
jgi:hypothetical protein